MQLENHQNHAKSSLAALSLAAIGIVYGDIGTSPLYTMKEVFSPEHGLELNEFNVFGVISLICWGLIIIVALKYVTLILRADNRGEGGIMALTALALESVGKSSKLYFVLLVLGLLGAALFYGDGVITPAVSVLSAIEGLEVATPAFKPYVVPITVLVIAALYAVQFKGTAGIGRWFGPIMVIWFALLAVMGVYNIAKMPSIIGALNPVHAFDFLLSHGWVAFLALGAVVLAFTGAEALYADMGHFGSQPIRIAWFSVVFPALALNYLGQGALLIVTPSAVSNPFYQQLGPWSVYPLVILSAVATVIASQATISGTFSMTKQAIALGILPRMQIIHTSAKEIGQIYIPVVNWLQLLVVVAAVVGFASSSNLASAYGIAVTGTMLVTSLLTFFVIRHRWKLNLALCLMATGFFAFIDFSLFAANALKIVHGGWFPLVLGSIMFVIMTTWKRGRELVFDNLKKHAIPLSDFLESLFVSPPHRVPGTAIFLRGEADGVPHALLHNLSHNKILHERVVFLTLHNKEIPWVAPEDRVHVTDFGHDCYQIDVNYGFKNEPDIPKALALCEKFGLLFEPMETSYFIARQTIVSKPGSGMALWREWLFVLMSRNARDAADYYRIPTNRVIEVGSQVEI
ncbi:MULTISPECIES: potassium transporter Kup [unclassified Undibacterium]|uniref:potassium transporter Kup n=1 Tax=unclassified Undibacterium TaxID=2630295 RepID=UPI002AC9778B|nr:MULTISPECIES: potassium transporter Kup [unclassified Undibacterium]MEB0138068.1 potassium transporter Kup [Undibacterium sp. CCC2.1]MEB0171194.1 potassium transporter Kup [Undibacterium sp. CCC1.1]MEB0175239.1 potassium transporter Kup [Undibacterium sp. CCC3.4]MEB0214647.1 potassium transporter Kup [Undibacterium sp. 5I2]WPX42414.1 potassium transporter Kup [Undibacterium sp. CCC3.4]